MLSSTETCCAPGEKFNGRSLHQQSGWNAVSQFGDSSGGMPTHGLKQNMLLERAMRGQISHLANSLQRLFKVNNPSRDISENYPPILQTISRPFARRMNNQLPLNIYISIPGPTGAYQPILFSAI